LRALVQRVSRASVSVDDRVISSIHRGLLAFVGVGQNDSEADSQYLADKVANLRIFPDDAGKFNLSALDISGELLVVSQFTLYASTRKGRRPSFTEAAPPEQAEVLLSKFVDTLQSFGLQVETGRFQARMHVELVNDGPVTIFIDSDDRHSPRH
jgi:D-aminoacyl-tRNA deacylase